MDTRTLLETTLSGAVADGATVTSTGESLALVPHGSVSHSSRTHVDDRGEVTEILDLYWGWHPDPITFVYT